MGNLKRDDGGRITPADFGLTTSTREKYNGHSDPAADLEAFKRQVRNLDCARPMKDDNPKLVVDAEEVKRYLETMNGT